MDVVSRVVVVILCAIFLLLSPDFSASQVLLGSQGRFYPVMSESRNFERVPRYNWFIGLRKYFSSFTSYQFPNPFPPNQDPLSRLEFPIDQWFVGIETTYKAPHWSLGCKGWVNLSRESPLKMQDSDWDDENRPFQKTIFSESNCRLNRGIMIDLNVALLNPLSPRSDLKPIVGYRYQHFFFTTHDGQQVDGSGAQMELKGDGIDFKQTFFHAYVGAVLDTDLRLGAVSRALGRLRLIVQADYAVIDAINEDLHLLRQGERITTENTFGHCWHVGLTGGFLLSESIRINIEGDFKRTITHGNHELSNRMFDIFLSFDGSRVWSDQLYVAAMAEFPF